MAWREAERKGRRDALGEWVAEAVICEKGRQWFDGGELVGAVGAVRVLARLVLWTGEDVAHWGGRYVYTFYWVWEC